VASEETEIENKNEDEHDNEEDRGRIELKARGSMLQRSNTPILQYSKPGQNE
jgi:hypothetical protein